MNKTLILNLLILFLTGCTSITPLEQALKLSGNNRQQLEQVLSHYSRHPEDSLKYQAACFLIENMPGHGWYEGPELDKYKQWVDSAYSRMDFVFRATLHEAFFQQPQATRDLVRKEDIENLDSNFLITYIDSTFSAISKRPWLNEITFRQMCEYVLPYRIGHEKPRQLFRLQDSIFKSEIAGILNCNDIYDATTTFCLREPDIFKEKKEIRIYYRGNYINYELSGCVGHAVSRSWRAKLMLCPVATDLTPAYPNRDSRHCWSVMVNNVPYNGISNLSTEQNTRGKIYRITYSHNPKPSARNGEYIPPFFLNPCYRDVTSSYNHTEDISIKPRQPITTTYGYLCVFNDLNWEPVAYAEYKNGKYRFQNVGRGVVYLPVTYPDGQISPISYPFILDNKGNTQVLQPDTNHSATVTLKRKYPLKQALMTLNEKFLKSIVEASNDPLFKQKDSIGTFNELKDIQWTSLKVKNTGKYRYWRIRSKDFFIIAECNLFDQTHSPIKPVLNGAKECLLYQSAFDDDPLSYATSYWNSIFQWDMGKEVSLTAIKCLLHNDGNDIWPGHWYELYYHDGDTWKQLEMKQATGSSVEFNHVPANALLWLRNLTTGREERVFTYTNGKVRFW